MYFNYKNQMRSIITNNDFVAIQFDSTLLEGSGIPPATLGTNGDYFLDRATGSLYHKSYNKWTIKTNLKGTPGKSSFTYIAYASDLNGTGFTLTFDPNLNFIAILETSIEIANPQASDFVGIWKNYKGEPAAEVVIATVSENLAKGAFVTVYGINNKKFVKNANASDTNSPATGYVLEAYNLGATATVCLDGFNTALEGLIPETTYYLDKIDGKVTIEAPGDSGSIIQNVGVAIDETTLTFDPQEIIVTG